MGETPFLQIAEEVWAAVLRGGPVMVPIFALGWLAWFLIFRQAVLHRDYCKIAFRSNRPLWGDRVIESNRNGDDLIAEQHARALPFLNTHLTTIARLAALAPMLGLLGTVTGMRTTFETITLHGFGNPVLLADGISEALLTTQAGLVVAFPILLAHNRLKNGVSRIEHRLDSLLISERSRHNALATEET